MFNLKNHAHAVAQGKPYRGALLWAQTIAHADEEGVWEPKTKVSLRRLLATGGAEECTPSDVSLAIRQCIAQGILERESSQDRLILARGGDGS